MQIIRPKHDFELGIGIPYFYLIGPVQGGGDWQHEMCRALERRVGECIIAVPNRWDDEHSLARYFVGTVGSHYEHQTDWKQCYIHIALNRPHSCLVCYLPTENGASPRNDGSPYARDTYGELGYLRGLMMGMGYKAKKRLPIVLGGHMNFPGLSVIRRNFDHAWGEPFPFCHSFPYLADRAMGMVFKN